MAATCAGSPRFAGLSATDTHLGTPNHGASTPYELLHEHAYEPLPPLPSGIGVLPEVYGLLMERTAKSKEERYATAELFLRDLDQILDRL